MQGDFGPANHAIVPTGGISGHEHGVNASSHPVVNLRNEPSAFRVEDHFAVQEVDQLYVGHQTDSQAHSVTDEFLLTARNGLILAVDLHQHNRLDLVGRTLGLLDDMRVIEIDPFALQVLLQCIAPADAGCHVDHSDDMDAVIRGHLSGVEAQISGAENYHAPRGQRLIAGHQ